MNLTDSDILRRMQSRIVSKDQFNFDTMSARPLLSMLDYSDLDKLYNIASSVRYSGNIVKKLNAIRDVMHNKGFHKIGQGTNRIVYGYFEDPSIVVKVATDKVGMKDNPAEFINQNYLKPFVTKVFEVSPDGVVGEFERVEPITSREEFLSCTSEVYDMLNIITKKYIMADVGNRFFMNYGIRSNENYRFGPVLLDFSYIYVPDANKLMCCSPRPEEPLGICGGWIDYDQGFNELVCLKCGSIYRAKELAKDMEENKIIRKGRKTKMKVAVNYKGNTGVKEINLDGQMGSGAFKQATAIVRPSISVEPVGKLRVATPIVAKEKVVEKVSVKEEKVEVVEEIKETPVVVEEKKNETIVVEVPVVKVEEPSKNNTAIVEEAAKQISTPVSSKKGMKVKVTNQNGTTIEKAVDKHVEESQKNSGVKVKDRHYKNNYGSDMPRRSQIQLTAITFEQLKELDFKYSSTDLEFRKMFFKAEHEKSNPSVMVDFDSIPKEKLELILGADFSEIDELKKELEKTKSDLNTTEEALINLRKIGSDNSETVNKLQQQIAVLESKLNEKEEENKKLHNTIKDYEGMLKAQEEKSADVPEGTEYDTDNLAFVSGTLASVDLISQFAECEVPKSVPSKNVIAIETEDGYVKDQSGKIICIGWMNNVPLNEVWMNGVEIDSVSFGTYDDIEEPVEESGQIIYGEDNNTEE